MLITDKGEKYVSSAGVTLTVTDLQVRLSHSWQGHQKNGFDSNAELHHVLHSCPTAPLTCGTRTDSLLLINSTKHNKLYLFFSEDAGNYSCAVKGREDLRLLNKLLDVRIK
ncbi:hypothetical protein KOW79_000054 [Hemibagrus wyckioides]|uniref:Uncharacterized protein n=1 Tax=Hemibagrus wyckioides TaxID=337641 RepID=A0A9D3N0C5_9TELE|nr:hypothetical protein KOW79_000054 [Hemibagrus wyckioides]